MTTIDSDRLPAPTPRVDRAGRLDADVACLNCGYNLRTLERTTNCPECAKPVAGSLEESIIYFSDPTWLLQCADTAYVMHYSCLTGLVILFLTSGLFVLSGHPAVLTPTTFLPCVGIAGVLMALLMLFGVIGVLGVDARRRIRHMRPRSRRRMRHLLILTLTAQIILSLIVALATSDAGHGIRLVLTISSCWVIIVVPPTFLLGYTGDLVRRLSPQPARLSNRLLIAYAVLTTVSPGVALLPDSPGAAPLTQLREVALGLVCASYIA